MQKRLLLASAAFALGTAMLPQSARAQEPAPPPPESGETPAEATPAQTPATEEADKEKANEETKDAKEEKREEKSSGHGLELIYVKGYLGGSYINMTSFNSSDLALQKSDSTGPSFGFGAGIRLLVLSLGARVTGHQLSAFSFWQVDAELGLHIPGGNWDPYFGLHGGYTFMGSLDSSSVGQVAGAISPSNNVSVTGADAGLQLGIDYYFNHFFSLGFEVSGNALFLHRPPVPLPANISQLPADAQNKIKGDPLYAHSGDSAGFGASLGLQLGLHF